MNTSLWTYIYNWQQHLTYWISAQNFDWELLCVKVLPLTTSFVPWSLRQLENEAVNLWFTAYKAVETQLFNTRQAYS